MTVLAPDIRSDAGSSLAAVLDQLAGVLNRSEQPDWSFLRGSAFDRLPAAFDLSEAETVLMALLTGSALSARVAAAVEQQLCANPGIEDWLGLIDGLSWASFAPGSVLRAWSLLQVHRAARPGDCPLGVDPRIADWCLGIPGPDSRLLPYLRALDPAPVLAPPHARGIAGAVRSLVGRASQSRQAVCVILGDGPATRERVAAEIAQALI